MHSRHRTFACRGPRTTSAPRNATKATNVNQSAQVFCVFSRVQKGLFHSECVVTIATAAAIDTITNVGHERESRLAPFGQAHAETLAGQMRASH